MELEPNDCLPIPAYKANSAIESCPNLIYIISMDFNLLGILDDLLPTLFDENEKIVWDLLNKFGGGRVRNAEDAFVFSMVRKYWEIISEVVDNRPFHVISAQKAIRILHTQPGRTPGIGLRAWGTGASAEVNVHVSIQQDTTPWNIVEERIISEGIGNIVRAVNRRRQEIVYDPEI